MTPQEYKEKQDFYTNEITRLRKEQDELRITYIADNRKFIDLDKVKLVYKNGKSDEVYIWGADCLDGIVYYSFLKVKNDGLPSKHSYYATGYWDWENYYTLELLEPYDENKTYQTT